MAVYDALGLLEGWAVGVVGGLTALLAHNGAKELADWWAAWRRQYKARHRADPIEDATDEPDPGGDESLDPPSGATRREGVSGPGSWPSNRRAPAAQTQVPVAPPPSNTPGTEPRLGARASHDDIENENDPMYKSWATPLRWAANGRYVHRIHPQRCPHMTKGKAITVWSEEAAHNWAEATKPRLTACPHCDPFNTPQPAKATSDG